MNERLYLLALAALLLAANSARAQDDPSEPPAAHAVVPIEGQLDRGDPTDKVRAGSYFKAYTYRLKAGTRYVIDLQSSVFDAFLRLEDSAGINLAQDDDSGGRLNARIVYTPLRTGDYKVIATSLGAGSVGKYQLWVCEDTPPGIPQRTWEPGGTVEPVRRTAVAPEGRYGDIVVRPLETLSNAESADEHGYSEYRFQIENRSEKVGHHVSLILSGETSGRSYGGQFIKSIQRTVDIGPKDRTVLSLWQPDIAVIGSGVRVEVDGAAFDERLGIHVPNRGNRFESRHMFRKPVMGGEPSMSHVVLVPQRLSRMFGQPGLRSVPVEAPDAVKNWPTNWLAYSSYDGVVVPGEELKAAPEVQTALWKYAETGGTLIIVGPGPSLPAGWSIRNEGKEGMCYYPGFGQCLVTTSSTSPDTLPLGQPLSIWRGQPWHQVTSADDANRQFPILDNINIPIRGLFAIMIVFTVLIGPVNIWLLNRWKRRIWLLWTVPALSLVTCSAVFGYMILSEGWSGMTRIEGITVLDETSQRATSLGWFAVYCPMTPGDGLHFDYETEVTPHFLARDDWRMYRRQSGRPLSIDWTNDQHLSHGWVSARVPAHFLVRGSSHRLERVILQNDEGKLSAVNGLNATIEELWVADADGRIHEAKNVEPGARAPLATTHLKANRQPAALYEVFGDNWRKPIERQPEKVLAPNTYLAVCKEAPFFDAGLPHARERRGRTVIVGISRGGFSKGGNDAR